MRVFYICAAVLLASILATANVYAGLGGSVGVYLPSSNDFKPGTTVSINYTKPILPYVSAVIQGVYNYAESNKKNSFDKNPVVLNTYGAALMGRVTLPVPIVDIYAATGIAVYNNKVSNSNVSINKTYYGILSEAGAGINFWLIHMGVNVQYFDNMIEGKNIGGFSVGVGGSLSF